LNFRAEMKTEMANRIIKIDFCGGVSLIERKIGYKSRLSFEITQVLAVFYYTVLAEHYYFTGVSLII